jgi:hypothetical protein
MGLIDIIIYIVASLFVAILGFICLVAWLIDEGFKSRYKEEQEALKKDS